MTKQTIIASAVIAGTAIISPIASFSISPIREALLGLTPEDQILHIADTIEADRIKSSDELATLKSLVEEQKATIEKQNKEMEGVKEDIEEIDANSLKKTTMSGKFEPIIEPKTPEAIKEDKENEERMKKDIEEGNKKKEEINEMMSKKIPEFQK